MEQKLQDLREIYNVDLDAIKEIRSVLFKLNDTHSTRCILQVLGYLTDSYHQKLDAERQKNCDTVGLIGGTNMTEPRRY